MIALHVVPGGEPAENHTLGDCPCDPRSVTIPRDDDTADIVQLHRSLDGEDELRATAA